MDIFSEQLVVRKKDTKDFLIIVGIVLAALALTFLLSLLLGAFSFVFVCGVWFGAWWLITRRAIEFEYIVTSSVLDIDKITAKRSRKRILTIELKEAERFMPYEEMPQKDIKTVDATPNGIEDGVYGVDFISNGQSKRLLFKPNEKVLSSAKQAVPSLVVLKN